MSEEIKAGDMVWGRKEGCKDFVQIQLKYVGVAMCGYMCWNGKGNMLIDFEEITTKDPNEKKCKVELEDGEEFWKYEDGYFGGYELPSLYSRAYFPLLQCFVVELGSGERVRVNNPIMWTNGNRYNGTQSAYYPNRCKIIGCIMEVVK